MTASVRAARPDDRPAVGAMLHPVMQAGETYPLPQGWSASEVADFWFAPDKAVFVAEQEGALLGTYYLRANQPGAGGHVANCGYVVAAIGRGRGIATALCRHSQDEARDRGFRAMQFNLVVSTNEQAVSLWRREGFATVGTLPGAFRHPRLGYVDAFVMYKAL